MIKTSNYLQKYIANGVAGRAQRYVDHHCDNAWTKNVEAVRAMVRASKSIDEMKAADEFNFQKTRDFMDVYFKSSEYVLELEREAETMLAVNDG